jgi:hypothetical protein
MTLVKAKLIALESAAPDIEFMFNPTQLDFSQQINLNKSSGARTAKGLPKVSFGYPEPCKLTINNLLFDTYEQGTSVLTYLQNFEKAVNFAEAGAGQEKRPPIYVFTWGAQQYLRCFITSLSYSLTMFLPDGTPVRAKINLTLEEVDEPVSQPGISTPSSVDREGDNRSTKLP